MQNSSARREKGREPYVGGHKVDGPVRAIRSRADGYLPWAESKYGRAAAPRLAGESERGRIDAKEGC